MGIWLFLIPALLIAALVAIGVYLYLKRSDGGMTVAVHHDDHEDAVTDGVTTVSMGSDEELTHSLDGIITFIKREGGRTTQKDIRKAFPLSEAKISLMVSDLEEQGKIKKIRKGRGNVIVLQ
jgi:uncharacterized membrane protein